MKKQTYSAEERVLAALFGEGLPVEKIYVSIAEAKAQFSELRRRASVGNERFIITNHGTPAVAVISITDLERLEAAERQPSTVDRPNLPPTMSEDDFAEFEANIQEVVQERQRPDWSRGPVEGA